MDFGAGGAPQSRRIVARKTPALQGGIRFNSDGTKFWVTRLYNGTGSALVAGRPYLVHFEGAASTTPNPQVTALAAQAGVQNQVVIATTALANGEWGDFVYQGHYDVGVEGTTDVAADDFLKVDAGVSTSGLVKDGTSRTAQSCAIACAAQASNAVVSTRVYLMGCVAVTSLASPESSVTLTAASSLTASGNDATTARFTVENLTNGTAATGNVRVASPTSAVQLTAFGSNFATAAIADYAGLFAEGSATGMIFALNADTQSWRFNAGGGNILTITGASPSVWTFQDATNLAFGTSTGVQIGTGATQKMVFYGGTPIVRPAAYTQTFSTADRTHAARTAIALTLADGVGTNDGTIGAITADASVIAAIQELAAAINANRVDDLDTASLVNSLVDDHQALGLAS